MFRYRLHSPDGDDLGEGTYSVPIKPARKILDDLHGAQSVPKRPGIGPQRQAAEGPETAE